jgi:hypothetical protein
LDAILDFTIIFLENGFNGFLDPKRNDTGIMTVGLGEFKNHTGFNHMAAP